MSDQASADDAKVLAAIADQKWFGWDLHRATRLSPRRMYRALDRLMERGLLEDGWDASFKRPRRWYRATPDPHDHAPEHERKTA